MTHLGMDTWGSRIQACALHQKLMHVVGAYLSEWGPEDINRLPVRLTAPIRSLDELHQRVIEIIHAETTFKGSNADWALLRELALVITAAAARARYLDLQPNQ